MLSVPWAVLIDGRPQTDRMNAYIEAIECTDNAGGTADTATLRLDDTDAQCILPAKGSRIEIELGGVKVFEGVVDAPEALGARGSGSQINVTCTSVDKRGKAKERLGLHKDDATLKDFLQAAAKAAGFTVKVDPALGALKRPYWSADGRSFLHLAQVLADELGATFKVRGKAAVFAKRGAGAAPGGGSLPSVSAIWGVNVVTYRLTPVETRPRFNKVRRRSYDRKAAKWQEDEVELGPAPGDPEAADIGGAAQADRDTAKASAGGAKTRAEREGGSGDVTIDFEPMAFAEGTCTVAIRSGVDGTYRIESRTHAVTRTGSETRLRLKQPQGEAGRDARKGGQGS